MNLWPLKGPLFWIQEARQQLSHTLSFVSPSPTFILLFFLLRRKWNGLQFIGGSLYAVIYTIKWQHIETNLWLNEFESQRNSKTPPQAFSQ